MAVRRDGLPVMKDPPRAAIVTDPPACDEASPGGVSHGVMPSDAELVVRARAGDREAFGLLVARYRDRFVRFARHMLGNREDAEEAVQDALVRAYRSLDRCEPQRFGAWAHQILVNRCRTRAQRGRWWSGRRVDLERAHEVGAASPLPDMLWREEIDRAVAALPVELREAFLLKHVDDMSYDDMSSVTGASVSALKMRVSRACERLRAALGGVA